MDYSTDEIRIKYKFSEDYNPKYINGAYGGISPKGEIVVNFYLERQPVPKYQSFAVKNNQIQQEIETKREPDDLKQSLVRFIQCGIVMDYQNAKEIHRWLGEHIKKYEEITHNIKDSGNE